MAWSANVLQIEAEKAELEKLQLFEVTKERVSSLEPLLQDIYNSRHPKQADYEKRRDLVCFFNDMAKDIFGNSNDTPVVVEFGSFVMDIFSTTSDLDLSVNFSTAAVPFPRGQQIKILKKFGKKLNAIQRTGHVSGVLSILHARVPIIKCVDNGTGVECDISVENRDGILKSQIIHLISSIDERFKKLSFLMKNWAKAHNINSSKDNTFNSLSIILLVAFHLQTRNPPILPPFAAIFKDGTDLATVKKSLPNFVNYGQRNKESMAELFVTLLIKLSSVKKLWPEGLCANVCCASWTSKTWGSKVVSISVEDFTDPSQNVARSVVEDGEKLIYKCIDTSLQHIFSFVDGQIGNTVKDLLFGQDGVSSIPRGIPLSRGNAVLPLVPSQAHQPKGIATTPGTNLVSQEQVQQAMLLGGSWQPAPVKAQFVAQHVDSTQHHHARGWDEMHAGDWERTQQAAAEGWVLTRQVRAGGWGGTEPPSYLSWKGTELPSSSGWGPPEQTIGLGRGWAGAVQPHAGRWGGTAGAGGWGRVQQQSGGGRGGTELPSSSIWGPPEPLIGLGRGWAGTVQPHAGRWGGTAGAGGWGRTQQQSGGGRVGTELPSSSIWGPPEPLIGLDRGWAGTVLPRAGGWGGTAGAGGWGQAPQ